MVKQVKIGVRQRDLKIIERSHENLHFNHQDATEPMKVDRPRLDT